jgi:RNA polymerase sigma-70 factor, ECF subfamily
MCRKDRLPQSSSIDGSMPPADALLLQQIRSGEPAAGHQFVQDHYPGVYRYLLYLTGSPDAAEDLTQETFLQAWRCLNGFEGRSTLRTWLHRIAHREFLQQLRSWRGPAGRTDPPSGGPRERQRSVVSLEAAGELAAPQAVPSTESVELRMVIDKLPPEERQVVILHYLEGYEYQEIAHVLGAPVGRVRHRLSEARRRLQQELGPGDLAYLNQTIEGFMRCWSWLPLEAMSALGARLTLVDGSLRDANGCREEGETGMSDQSRTGMSRRKLLGAAGSAAAVVAAGGLAGAAGAPSPQNPAEIVDDRLTRKVTLAVKAIALVDLCERLLKETGIALTAAPSVADEKVTLFCKSMPLRDVMRQLSRPFGYTWLRQGKAGEFRYELAQDLRSQLLEEELRNRDRNAAMLDLQQDIERYRPYLGLSPDEALQRAKSAPAAEKPLLETMSGRAWGPIQMYFRLSSQELAALRAGQELKFAEVPRPGEQPRVEGGGSGAPLPPEVGRGVLQSQRQRRLIQSEQGWEYTPEDTAPAAALAPAQVPEARGEVRLRLGQSDLGQFTIDGTSGLFTIGKGGGVHWYGANSAGFGSGKNPRSQKPDNATANHKLARDPALQQAVSVQPQPSVKPPPASQKGESDTPKPRVTTADVLEALHRATGMPIVADFYTRLYSPQVVSAQGQVLFETLNQLADAMRLRWNKDGAWLQFRSTSYYDDRLKEVPNRLLSRWSGVRQKQGALSLDDLVEITQLTDAQLDAAEMAEGARELWGLAEWDLARGQMARPHLRYLASFAPERRQQAMSAAGLSFSQMTLAQQQQFLSFAVHGAPLQTLQELDGAVLRIEYTQPGSFQWGEPGWQGYSTRWAIRLGPGREDRRVPRPFLVARTRQELLTAVRQIDAGLREALFQAARRDIPQGPDTLATFEEQQVFPTRRDLTFIYIPSATNARSITVYAGASGTSGQF